MTKNGGIIGKETQTGLDAASGLFDTFDQYNGKLKNSWPNTRVSSRVELSGISFNEGDTLVATIYVSGIDIGETVSWELNLVSGNAITPTDFDILSGNFSVTSDYFKIQQIEISADLLTEGTEVFNITIRYNSELIGTSENFTVTDTSIGNPEPQALYDFSSFTFTNVGITGRFGPTLANCIAGYNTSANPWLTDTAYFNVVTEGYQLWTVPDAGNYEISAIGASGGIGQGTFGTPGFGARMVSTFSLTKGQKIQIIVGQQGLGLGTSSCGLDGGGGGSSFVFTETGTCLLAAGGGGGGSNNSSNRDPTLRNAPDSTSGNKGSGTTGGLGGTNGNGGFRQVGSCVQGGAGGAGILTSGETDGQPQAAQPYANGFSGGTGHGSGNGGFGGGGGSGNSYAGGGGGGYSGGGGGGLNTCSCNDMGNGGGGGSFSSAATYVYTAQTSASHGSVTITKL